MLSNIIAPLVNVKSGVNANCSCVLINYFERIFKIKAVEGIFKPTRINIRLGVRKGLRIEGKPRGYMILCV